MGEVISLYDQFLEFGGEKTAPILKMYWQVFLTSIYPNTPSFSSRFLKSLNIELKWPTVDFNENYSIGVKWVEKTFKSLLKSIKKSKGKHLSLKIGTNKKPWQLEIDQLKDEEEMKNVIKKNNINFKYGIFYIKEARFFEFDELFIYKNIKSYLENKFGVKLEVKGSEEVEIFKP